MKVPIMNVKPKGEISEVVLEGLVDVITTIVNEAVTNAVDERLGKDKKPGTDRIQNRSGKPNPIADPYKLPKGE